jgi:DnaJ-class molecular chaperone
MIRVICPKCNGKGDVIPDWDCVPPDYRERCNMCLGEGALYQASNLSADNDDLPWWDRPGVPVED